MDVDHIAAIDNVTRKLVNDGQRPVAVGFFSPLAFHRGPGDGRVPGHRGTLLKKDLMQYSDRIDMIGSSVCALVLYVLALMNVPVLWRAENLQETGQRPNERGNTRRSSSKRAYEPVFQMDL